MNKICINGVIREMTSEELKEYKKENIQTEIKESFEDRLSQIEKLLEKFLGLNK